MSTAVGVSLQHGVIEFAWAIDATIYKFADGRRVGSRSATLRGLPHSSTAEWLVPGSDALVRDATDVAVSGSAWARDGKITARSTAALHVGAASLRVAVAGRRYFEWNPKRISEPEAFEKIALSNRNAYGGVDPRLPLPPFRTEREMARLVTDYPGIYPRNPSGKGYVVVDEPLDGIELPNLEDPDNLLTSDRVVVGDPAAWWRQPLPRSLAFRDASMFPRLLPLGGSPPFDPPEDESLEEIRIGELPRAYRSEGKVPASVLFKEAPFGMSFAALSTDMPIVCEGMTPEGRSVSMTVPEPPTFEFTVEGRAENVRGRALSILVFPEQAEIRVAHYAKTSAFQRALIPGVHRNIGVQVEVSGQKAQYQAPETFHDLFVAHGLRASR